MCEARQTASCRSGLRQTWMDRSLKHLLAREVGGNQGCPAGEMDKEDHNAAVREEEDLTPREADAKTECQDGLTDGAGTL